MCTHGMGTAPTLHHRSEIFLAEHWQPHATEHQKVDSDSEFSHSFPVFAFNTLRLASTRRKNAKHGRNPHTKQQSRSEETRQTKEKLTKAYHLVLLSGEVRDEARCSGLDVGSFESLEDSLRKQQQDQGSA